MVKRGRKSTLICGIALFAIMLSSVVMAVLGPRILAVATEGWSDVTFEESYVQGDELVIPQRTYTVGGEKTTATSVVLYPSGKSTILKNIELDEVGLYTITYTAVVNGKFFKTAETIMVKYPLVSFGNEKTSVEYGAHSLAPTVNGLVVRLAEGDTLLFNQTIDVSNVTLLDTLFECFVTADIPGTLDFGRLFVRFTDINNPDKYFTVRYIHTKSSSGGPFTYVLAGGNDQPMSGYESANSTLHVEDNWGAMVRHSFLCVYGENVSETGKTRLSVRFNADSFEVYNGNSFIIDFDNPKQFSQLWEGFDSNQVQVSVWAEDYSTSSANFVITNILGVDLTCKEFAEEDAPVIEIDCDYENDQMPVAKVGTNYPIPSATAFDIYSGERKVDVKVYYNYTGTPSLIEIKNGKFLPQYVGEYVIVYTATDALGNVAEEVLWVNSVSDLDKPTITFNGEFPSEITAGSNFVLPDYTIEGGSGISSVVLTVNDGAEQSQLSGETYLFNRVSKHVFTYTLTDYIGQVVEKTFEVECVNGGVPVFVEGPQLPRYLISGANYVLDEVYAVNYSTGLPVEELASIVITDANGTKTYAAGEVYVPAVNNNYDTIKFEYKVGSQTLPVEILTVKAKDATGVYASNYLHRKGLDIELTDSYAILTATEANGSWTFANSLIAENVDFLLSVDPGAKSFNGLKITFTDSKDSSVSISAYLYKSGKNTLIKIGKTEFTDEEVGFTLESKSNVFRIGYENKSVFINKSTAPVDVTDNGEKFNSFSSGKVYISCEFINAKVGATYNVWEINSHKINTSTADRLAPKIVLSNSTGGSYGINETTVLPVALAGDTLDPNTVFTVRVENPSGDVVITTDGIKLDNVDPTREYEIKLTEYGQYKVNYSAKDTFSGRTTTANYILTVEDRQGPVITFKDEFKLTAKVGDVLVIPNYTLSDNLDDASDIKSMNSCYAPNGVVIEMANSNAVLATIAGVYQFRILAIDLSGNITLFTVNVTVVE